MSEGNFGALPGPEDKNAKKFQSEQIPAGLSIEDARQLDKAESPIRTELAAKFPGTWPYEIFQQEIVDRKIKAERSLAKIEGMLAELAELRELYEEEGDVAGKLSREDLIKSRKYGVTSLKDVFKHVAIIGEARKAAQAELREINTNHDVELKQNEAVRKQFPPLKSFNIDPASYNTWAAEIPAFTAQCQQAKEAATELKAGIHAARLDEAKLVTGLFVMHRDRKLADLQKVIFDLENQLIDEEKKYETAVRELRARGVARE